MLFRALRKSMLLFQSSLGMLTPSAPTKAWHGSFDADLPECLSSAVVMRRCDPRRGGLPRQAPATKEEGHAPRAGLCVAAVRAVR